MKTITIGYLQKAEPIHFDDDVFERLVALFETHVDRTAGPDGCHLWHSGRRTGYGRFSLKSAGDKRAVQAHRFALEAAIGPLIDGHVACHTCESRYPAGDVTHKGCCNPLHLVSGTIKRNAQDMLAAGRDQLVGMKNSRAKFSDAVIQAAFMDMHRYDDISFVARKHGMSWWHLKSILMGKRRRSALVGW